MSISTSWNLAISCSSLLARRIRRAIPPVNAGDTGGFYEPFDDGRLVPIRANVQQECPIGVGSRLRALVCCLLWPADGAIYEIDLPVQTRSGFVLGECERRAGCIAPHPTRGSCALGGFFRRGHKGAVKCRKQKIAECETAMRTRRDCGRGARRMEPMRSQSSIPFQRMSSFSLLCVLRGLFGARCAHVICQSHGHGPAQRDRIKQPV